MSKNKSVVSKVFFLFKHPLKAIKFFRGGIHPSDIEFESILCRLPERATIVEAGTSTGMHTELFANAFPRGTIIGFEPIEEFFEVCRKRTKHQKNVKIYNMALGQKSQNQVQIYWDESSQHESASILTPLKIMKGYYPELSFQTTRVVAAICLDEVMDKFNLTHIDLLWLDLQGAELGVISDGGLDALNRTHHLHVEVARKAMYKGGATRKQVIKFLQDEGFCIELSAMGWMYGNVLFRNKNFHES